MAQVNDAVRCGVDRHAVGPVVPVPEHEKTWKNVVKVPPGFVTTVVVAFKLVDTNQPYPFDATAEPGYVYHCHVSATSFSLIHSFIHDVFFLKKSFVHVTPIRKYSDVAS
jgi:hypothetical protein